jgi:hypothetical protein
MMNQEYAAQTSQMLEYEVKGNAWPKRQSVRLSSFDEKRISFERMASARVN